MTRFVFPELKELYLDDNIITDIEDLKNISYKNLKTLSLKDNKISDISIFNFIKFKKLEDLNLRNNRIDETKYALTISILKYKIKKFMI